jgi:hypothetical protein
MTQDNQKPKWHQPMLDDLADPAFKNTVWNGRTTDWFLQSQVLLINNSQLSMSITLFTSAGMVTGQLISVEQYFKLYAELFSNAIPGDQKEDIRQRYEEMGKRGNATEEDELEPAPQYIHLKEARLCTPNGQTPNAPGLLWRGTIASISGFALGSLNA